MLGRRAALSREVTLGRAAESRPSAVFARCRTEACGAGIVMPDWQDALARSCLASSSEA